MPKKRITRAEGSIPEEIREAHSLADALVGYNMHETTFGFN